MHLLPKRLSHCFLSGEPFEQGSEYISFLDCEGNRRDYCSKCWNTIEKPKEGHFWKGKIPYKKEKSLRPDERALQLFREVEDGRTRFALALYLQRKHQLIQRTRTIYEILESGEIFNVESVFLTFEEGEALAKEIDLALHSTVQN